MKIYELILLLSFIAVVIDYWKNREIDFIRYILKIGYISYMLRALIVGFSVAIVMGKIIYMVDWSWLTYKLW